MALRLVLTLFLAAIGPAMAGGEGEKAEKHFTFPAEEGLTFYEKDTVNVSWVSNIDNTALWLFCREGDDGEIRTKSIIDDVPSHDGYQLVLIDFWTNCDRCWFNLKDTVNGNGYGFNSLPFALSTNGGSTTTVGLDPATATSTASSTATDASTASSSASAPAEDEEADEAKPHGGLSTGATAGIAAGVAIGIIGIGAMAVAFWLVRRRNPRRGGDRTAGKSELDPAGSTGGWYEHLKTPEPPQPTPPPSELEDRPPAQELPATYYQYEYQYQPQSQYQHQHQPQYQHQYQYQYQPQPQYQ